MSTQTRLGDSTATDFADQTHAASFRFHNEGRRNGITPVVSWYGTEGGRSGQTLPEETRDFRNILDAIAQFIIVLAPDGTTVHANQMALEQTGLTGDGLMGQDFFSLAFLPEDVAQAQAERVMGLASGAPFELELRAARGDGIRWTLIRFRPQKDHHGQIVRWYATGTDIDGCSGTKDSRRLEHPPLSGEIERTSMFEELVGSSEPMQQVVSQLIKVAPSDSTVLILGESGTGKELVACAIHRRSNRSAKPFVRVNCAAIPQSLIASELFGHEKGAFTGALQRRVGRFESADGGTVFLDEVGDLPMETQIALLRVLQEREFERVGSNQPVSVNVRVVAATNRDLKAAIAAGTFREDLFYRLNVFPIQIPPLRQRATDIPLLLQHFIRNYARKAGKRVERIEQSTLELLVAYGWPGNIRELQNVVERAVVLCDSETFTIDKDWLKRESPAVSAGTLATLADREVELIEDALAKCNGRVSGPAGAAAQLKIPRQTLESKIKHFRIDKHRLRVAGR